METFEEKWTAWLDDQLSGRELSEFEASLPDKAAAQAEKAEAKKLGALLKRGKEVRVFNTLCGATTSMQKTAVELAPSVDAMVIIGGRQSANTAQLAEVCRKVNPRVHQVESAEEIDPSWFTGVRRVGVSAGASTPDEVIAEVVARLTDLEPGQARSA